MKDVTILIPALNEEKTIGRVIGESTERGWTVLVGDNRSTDRTYEVSADGGVVPIIVHKKGQGCVVRALLKHVSTPLTALIDADYTYSIEDVQRALQALVDDDYDMVMGHRKYRERGSMPSLHVIGNYLLSLQASILYGYRIRDINSGLKVFKTHKLKELELTSDDFTMEADIFINAIRNRCKVGQILVGYKARPDGSKSKLRILDGLKIGWFLIKERFK